MNNIDPVTLEVVGNYLVSTVREMGATLMRTAYSVILREQMDCTTALFDPQGQLIAQADHVPSHQGTLAYAARYVAADFELDPGDVVVLNHPYRGGTHHPDIMIFRPVFHDGRCVAIAAALGHHIDVGGRSPGSVATDARDVFEEGLIIPPLKLYKRGVLVQEVLDIIAANIRVPRETLGDIRAEIAATTVGERRYIELCERYGADRLSEIVHGLLDHSEAMVRRDLAAYPDGQYSATGYMDSDGISEEPVTIAVTVTLDRGAVTIDFAGSSPQLKGPFNASISSVEAACFCAVRYMVNPAILQNAGCYRPIKLLLPPRSVVNPESPAPLSGRFHTLERIAGTIVQAFNGARGAEAVGNGHNHLTSFSTSGRMPEGDHARSGETFVLFEYHGGGWGGTSRSDGLDATFGLMANSFDNPIEAIELRYPLMIERYEFIPDSGGGGAHRGGMGIRKDIRYLQGSGYFTNRSDGQKFPPQGVLGGGPGRPSAHALVRANGTVETLPSKITNVTISAGDLMVLETAGGGGYGDPRARDRQLVQDDLLDGKISAHAARSLYGLED
ncbi:N-methylhydantoinase B [Rhodoligotrophos appendicifer]|uniref:hydantoinase B/oxoprolinase family protein n=1 Tax=Rhodoligotrophos appendicifer TaxID=987056 RepID=UPI0011872863|nr:hydantoinase B/oxoprolinase family protein [Rhodoligotrophos appendicifer]